MFEQAVSKFGGSSIALPDKSAELFLQDSERNRIAVVSAVGKNPSDPTDTIKVTDWLDKLEEAVKSEDRAATHEAQAAVIDKNRRAFQSLGNAELKRLDDMTWGLMKPENAANGFKWVGERISALGFAALTGAMYVPSCLRFTKGRLNLKQSIRLSQQMMVPLLDSGYRQLVTESYFGFDTKDLTQVVVLPRGGGDTAAVVYTGALDAASDNKWINDNYTDKDGILTADPDIISGAHLIRVMTHDEVRETMHGVTERNGIVHGDAIAVASRLGVEMHVRNTFNPETPGTRIVSSRTSDPKQPIICISGKSNITAMNVYDMGMADAENYLSRILVAVGNSGMSISNIPTGEDRFKLIFNGGVSNDSLDRISDFVLEHAISGTKARVDIIRDQGAVYLIGQELTNPMTYTSILGRTATLLASSNFAMREVISHEQSPSLALTVEGSEVANIIQLLHGEFIEPFKSDST